MLFEITFDSSERNGSDFRRKRIVFIIGKQFERKTTKDLNNSSVFAFKPIFGKQFKYFGRKNNKINAILGEISHQLM